MKPAKYIADHLRQVLINGASAPHTAEVEHFFKNEVQSRGWYTHELRKLARRFTKVIKHDAGLAYLVEIADKLFRGNVLEEKALAVLLLETSTKEMTRTDFELFESWLDRINSWADHDSLCQYLIGPLMSSNHALTKRVFEWAKSKDKWHRRAAAVSLIRGVRDKKFEAQTRRITMMLLSDDDLMVQKGLGWLLREAAKYNPKFAVPLLKQIAPKAPRLVLRTGCETLPLRVRSEIVALPKSRKQALAAAAR